MKRIILNAALLMFVFLSSIFAAWNKADLGIGGGAMHGVTLGNGENDGIIRVYGAGSNDIYEFTHASSSWVKVDLGNTGGAMNGVTVANGRTDGTMRVYGAGNGYLYEYTYSSGWTNTNTFGGGGGDVFYNVAAGNGRNNGIISLYYPDMNLSVYEQSFSTSAHTWSRSNVFYNTYSMLGVAVGNGRNDSTTRVYGSNDNGHVYEFTYSAGSWRTTGDLGGGQFMYSVAIGAGRSGDSTMRVYGGTSDGSYIYESSYSIGLSTWTAPIALGAGGGAIQCVAIGNGENDSTTRVYGACGDGNIYEFTYSAAGWNIASLGGSSGSYMYGVAVGNGRNDGVTRVYAACADSHIYEFTYTGTISGKVTSSNGTTPIPGALVEVWQNGSVAGKTTADASGNYTLIPPSPGTCIVVASASGYSLKTQNINVTGGSSNTANFSLSSAPVVSYYTVTTIAGNGTQGFSGDNGPAVSAQISGPTGVAVDSSGNVYIADQSNNRIRMVNTLGIIKTIAGNGATACTDNVLATGSGLSSPYDVKFDSSGNMYIADLHNNRIRKVDTALTITTVVGNGVGSYSGDNGAATSATINGPTGVAFDIAGNMYIVECYSSRVRKVNTSGIITTIAGNGNPSYSGDNGPATSASFNTPELAAADALGNVYIADQSSNRIRKVDTSGTITTIAGNGTAGYSGDNGPATSAAINYPTGITVDASGNLYITDMGNNRIRKINSAGIITTIAGNGTQGYSGDNGTATSAEFAQPFGSVAIDASGNVYVADPNNNRIRKLTPSAVNSSNSTLPVLSWEAGYANGAQQSSGTVNTVVNFAIHYADPNGLAPQSGYPKLHIAYPNNVEWNVSPFTMNVAQTTGDYITGKKYIYSCSMPGTGTFHYWFEAYNSVGTAAGGVEIQKQTISITTSNTATGGSTLNDAHPYPSFANLSQGGTINFAGITPSADVKIFTPAGNLIKTLKADANGVVAPWDGSVEGGGKAASGTYIVRASDSKGNKKTFKIMLVK